METFLHIKWDERINIWPPKFIYFEGNTKKKTVHLILGVICQHKSSFDEIESKIKLKKKTRTQQLEKSHKRDTEKIFKSSTDK